MCKKCDWKFQPEKSLKTICEGLPNELTLSRPANNNKLLQINFSEMKFKLSHLTLCGKKISQNFLMVPPEN